MDKIRNLKNDKIKEVRGRGLMIGIELYTPQKPVRQRLVYEQHLTFTKEMADEFVERLQKAL